MTALLAHELVPGDEGVTVPMAAIRQEGSSGLVAGEQLDIEKLRQLALVSSSNDAAFALAASVGTLLGTKDPTSQFIAGMNIRADELGLLTLDFKNTTGLDVSLTEPGAIGSARDVSFLMEYIISNYPEIITPTQDSATRIYNAAGAYHDINNTNEVALQIPNMIGSKTGYTDLAGGNLTIAFDAGLNRPIIITVLGSTRDERFSDVLALVSAVQETLSE
jgi:D-alanyl-D-alanine carboxypeptidase